MIRPRGILYRLLLSLCVILTPWSLTGTISAQTTVQSDSQKPDTAAAPAEAVLQIQVKGKTITLHAADLDQLPHKTVTVVNGHTKVTENYSGVPLSSLLAKAGAPLGDQLHGKAMGDFVVATGSDGYRALLSLAEVDPAFHSGDVIVADKLEGHPLIKQGPLQLIVSEDKRPARWVRNLVAIEVVEPAATEQKKP